MSAAQGNLSIKCTVDDIWPLVNKRVLIRVDFNVPVKKGVITNDYRIRQALPTIKRITDHGGICIVMSHLGRPKGAAHDAVDAVDQARTRKALLFQAMKLNVDDETFFGLLSYNEKKEVLLKSGANELADTKDQKKGFTSLGEKEQHDLIEAFKRSLQDKSASNSTQLYEEEYSMKPVAARLSELLKQEVIFAPDCLDAAHLVDALKPGDVMVLENVRFYATESGKKESERLQMARILASYADYFVSDAFGTAHRDAATMTGIPKVLGHGVAGYLMGKEIEYFGKVLGNPPKPVCAIVGGAKVSDKILLLENMLPRINKLVIGGAMAYTFLHALGTKIGTSKVEQSDDIIPFCNNLLKKAQSMNVEVLFPVDHVCHTEFADTDSPLVTPDAQIPDGYMALDIGPKTVALFQKTIGECKTAIWNGPMGVFEKKTYCNGTFAIAKTLGDATEKGGMLSIIGGGDSASAAEACNEASRMSHVSTGGGASLELLEGKVLPGVAILSEKK